MNLWLDQRVADGIVARSEASFPLETGGLLVGYMTEQGPVVTALIGAGTNAIATATSFLPDAHAQQIELNDIYSRTQGQDTYLGDWHSHPTGLPMMSRRDRRTLTSIARHSRARLSRPTMLIAAGAQGRWELGAFIAERRFLGVSIDRIAIRMFCADDLVNEVVHPT